MKKTQPHLDRSAFSIGSLSDDDEKKYWQILYGYDPGATRLQKIFEIVDLKPPPTP